MTNNMSPLNGLILDEKGQVHSLVTLLKDMASGKRIELQKGDTHIQWKYEDVETWTDLIAIADLKGAKGDTGAKGDKGDTGATGANGWGTKAEYDALVARITKLETPA